MFKENIRQPIVVREGEIVGVVKIMDIFLNSLKSPATCAFYNADTLSKGVLIKSPNSNSLWSV